MYLQALCSSLDMCYAFRDHGLEKIDVRQNKLAVGRFYVVCVKILRCPKFVPWLGRLSRSMSNHAAEQANPRPEAFVPQHIPYGSLVVFSYSHATII